MRNPSEKNRVHVLMYVLVPPEAVDLVEEPVLHGVDVLDNALKGDGRAAMAMVGRGVCLCVLGGGLDAGCGRMDCHGPALCVLRATCRTFVVLRWMQAGRCSGCKQGGAIDVGLSPKG